MYALVDSYSRHSCAAAPEQQQLHDRYLPEKGADHERADATAVLEVRLRAPARTQHALDRGSESGISVSRKCWSWLWTYGACRPVSASRKPSSSMHAFSRALRTVLAGPRALGKQQLDDAGAATARGDVQRRVALRVAAVQINLSSEAAPGRV